MRPRMVTPGVVRMVVVTIVTVVLATVDASQRSTQYCDVVPDALDPPPYPQVPNQYSCYMEVVSDAPQNPGDPDMRLEMFVKEVYDEPGNMFMMKIGSKYYREKYILDWNTKQMLFIHMTKNNAEVRECVSRPLSEGVIFFPPILGTGQNLSVSHIVGPGTALGILNWNETHYKGEYTMRGMTADRWDWCGLKEFENETGSHNISMATYWSSSKWNMPVMPTVEVSIPLGWEVEVHEPQGGGSHGYYTVETLVHNILEYSPGVVDFLDFKVPDGLYCEGMVSPEGHPFPDFSKDRLFTFSLEMRDSRAKDFTWADGWYDFEKQLYRIDHEIVSTPRERITATEVFDFNDGLAFTFGKQIAKCRITIINDTKTDWSDITGIGHLWADSPNAFFGSDLVNYTYYGPRPERDMDGDEWRALRSDWPLDVTGGDNHMIWMWTFATKNVTVLTSLGDKLYEERQVPIGLSVTAQKDFQTSFGTVAKGTSFDYQIYDFNLESDVKFDLYSDGGVFDVYNCYSANWRDHLKFKLDVSSWPEVVNTPLLTSARFNEYWQILLAKTGTVSTLRITRVKTIVEESNEVWIEFVLLYRHPEIGELDSDLYAHLTPGFTAHTLIATAINNGEISFGGQKPGGGEFLLEAVRGSLALVVDPECTSTTAAPTTQHTGPTKPTPTITTKTTTKTTTRTTTTSTASNAQTEPSVTDSSTIPYIPPGDNVMYTSGDLAGVGVGLLVVGLAFGAGGTFLVVVKRIHITIMNCCKR
ncbi:uncharacterized protein LOC134762511 isoform X2 [Penaeus indicus]|uniref:uncharacterized protein LOC134762511 isoform X2 n=1 Tax=Penaeus indicus TaxID=29960 RepID=UPI00300CF293